MPLGAARITLLAFQPSIAVEAEVIRRKVGVSAEGNAQVDTAQSKFGGASFYADGSGDDNLAIDKDAYDWTVFNDHTNSNNYTIECWIRSTNVSTTNAIFGTRNSDATNNWDLEIRTNNGNGTLRWFNGNSELYYSSGGVVSANTWHHIAAVIEGADLTVYVDGTAEITQTRTDSNTTGGTDFFIGKGGFPTLNKFYGNIDEFRISDTARYTANFTPSTTPFQNDESTLLLLHMDGTDGSTFFEDDNGVRSKVGVSAVGNAQVDTAQSKFGGASALFDGTDDRLVSAKDDQFIFDGDFTWECWIRAVDLGNSNTTVILSNRGSFNATNLHLLWRGLDEKIQWGTGGSGALLNASALSYNTWYHLAIVRSSGAMTLYINGTAEATTFSYSGDIGTTTDNFITVGGLSNGNGTEFNGNIDEVRISNTARYTSNFTPSTTPFQNDQSTLLLLHMDGTDASTDFIDDNGYHTPGRTAVHVSPQGNAQVDTAQSKFGGASAVFDGSDDYLQCPSPNNIDDSATDFTFEGWFRFDINPESQTIGGGSYMMLATVNSTSYILCQEVGGEKSVQVADSGTFMSFNESSGGGWSTNNWYHIAVVRNSDQYDIYLDGVALPRPTTSTKSGGFAVGGNFTIGRFIDSRGSFDGNIDELRISNIARYTANFTPATEPFQNDANTLLLLHMDGTDGSTTFTDDIGGRSTVGVSAVGNAQVDTAQSKFGGASALFDGSGDYLLADNDVFAYGSNPFTWECWWYNTGSTSTYYTLIATQAIQSALYHANDNLIKFYYSGSPRVSSTSTFSLNTWYHVAVTYDGTDLRMFVNGTLEDTLTITLNGTETALWIGKDSRSPGQPVNGNIDEVRISNTARYTSGFTPQTEPFQNDANTLLLLHMDGTDGSTTFIDDNGVPPDYNYGA